MALLIGALTMGLILSLLALGTFISFRVFDLADITVDGSITLGAAVTAVLLVAGVAFPWAMLTGFAAALVAGSVTGLLQTKFGIDSLLSGILVMTALYSVNLHVMGKSNVPLLSVPNLSSWCENIGVAIFGGKDASILGWLVSARDLVMLGVVFVIVVITGWSIYLFLLTRLGTAMRASGSNPAMLRALGVNVELYRFIGLALANGLVGLAGALLAQYQGFADAQMGIGMIVAGLASVIIGESLTAKAGVGSAIVGAVMGSVIFRLLVAIALRWGLNPNDLKLITALFVLVALVIPKLVAKCKGRLRHA